jgi:hypothetical protein
MTDADITIDNSTAHYVDWGAIIAGSFVAVAISSLFLTFGSAVGLSMASFQNGKSASLTALVVAGALWLLWVQVSSFVAGGYVAGRLRRRIGDGTPHEAEIRDGSHGLIVWAVGVVIASMLAISGLSGAASVSPMDYFVEKMLRSDTSAAPITPTVDAAQISRVLTNNLGSAAMDSADKNFLVSAISTQSGLPQAEAQARLDQTVATLKAQADSARRYGILLAFLTAASFLISGVAAWWAATSGGKHRNEGVDHTHLLRWR